MARPSSYDPAYCEQVIEMGHQGYSVVEMAAEIGVGRTTLERDWPDAHPEFSQALTHARDCSQAWWERQARVNLVMPQGGGTFQASAWSRSMAARFPNDWREKTEQKIEGEIAIGKITRTIVKPE
jgi:hypothetical protein